jgi:hypothetical protein
VISDLAVPDPHHVNTLEVNFAVGWGHAQKRPFVGPVVRFVSRYAVAIGELPMNLRVKVGECITNATVECTHPGFVGRHAWLRRVVDEVVSEKFFENVESSISLNLFDIPSHHSFRGGASV